MSIRPSTLSELLEDRIVLSAFTVTTLADSGAGSLRDAIDQANSNPGNDSIEFDASLSGEITLSSGELTLSDTSGDITISGRGASQLTISGNGNSRVFNIESGVFANISGLTISNGQAEKGGGISNSGTLTLNNTIISGNTATTNYGGGILNEGNMNVVNSTLSGNSVSVAYGYSVGGGAAIFNSGALSILSSTLSGNTAHSLNGGGVYNASRASLTITGSTFSGNVADGGGGAIFNTDVVQLINSTLTGNSANFGGGIDSSDGELTITNSTISGNTANAEDFGGAINYSGTLIMNNSILANSTNGLDLSHGGAIHSSSGSNNLVENGDIGGLSNTITGQDPMLGSLSDNGGPTQTLALLEGSSAINAGNNSLAVEFGTTALTTDQRGLGFRRITDGTVDIGAFEYESGPPIFTVTNLNDSGDGSLRDAIEQANSNAGRETIVFDSSLSGQITLTSGQLILSDTTGTISLEGLGANLLTITGSNLSRIFEVQAGVTATISGVTISDGYAQYGGGVRNDGILTIAASTISGNTAQGPSAGGLGGGVYNSLDATLTIVNSTVSGNTVVNGSGGGVFNHGSLTVTNSTISGNTATGNNGGGIVNYGSATVTSTTISGNSIDDAGGAGIGNAGTLVLNNTIIANSLSGFDLDNYGTMSGSHNLIENADSTAGLSNTITGQDPLLGDLEYNGGPTQTHALLVGSVAVNAGDNLLSVNPENDPLRTDQRGEGYTRIVGVTVDIGAYELSDGTSETFTVTTLADSGTGSLRDAIDQANANEGDEIIQFSAALAGGTITLTSGQLTLSDTIGTMTIVGLGADQLTISGNGNSRVFQVETGVTASISGLTISDGKTIYAYDDANNGGGIDNYGFLTLANSTISGNSTVGGGGGGGGIYNRASGQLTVTGSTLANNSGDNGAGITNNGKLSVSNSTFSGNSGGFGGGILNTSPRFTLEVSNSTFYGNSGSAIMNMNSLVLNNSILANSLGSSDLDGNSSGGTLSGSNNLIQWNNTTGLVNTITGVDPMLGDLQDNGGPTPTMALLAGSAAINAGDNSLADDPQSGNALTTDQRGAGFSRITGGTVDIGAYEYQSSPAPTNVVTNSFIARNGRLNVNGHHGDDIIGLFGTGEGIIEVRIDTTGDGHFDTVAESFQNVKSIRVDLGEGNDSLFVGGDLQLRKGLKITGGSEADRVHFVSDESFFNSTTPTSIDAKVKIKLGDGDNHVRFEGSTFEKNVTLKLGSGDDGIVSNGATFGKKLKVLTGDGDDVIAHSNNTYFSRASFLLGGGDDVYSEFDGTFDKHWFAHFGPGSDTLDESGNQIAGRTRLWSYEERPRT
ncbi:right-handed parallel beta-helix repeat-containing protein [Thalassoglobus sp. JC818]|uniref:beta strand repeat-containing protein n=1 Tax=Thalassoglobus sp. JC818 TaxID=3232136 RepID=UPI0034574DA3